MLTNTANVSEITVVKGRGYCDVACRGLTCTRMFGLSRTHVLSQSSADDIDGATTDLCAPCAPNAAKLGRLRTTSCMRALQSTNRPFSHCLTQCLAHRDPVRRTRPTLIVFATEVAFWYRLHTIYTLRIYLPLPHALTANLHTIMPQRELQQACSTKCARLSAGRQGIL